MRTYDDERYGTISIYQQIPKQEDPSQNKPVLKFVKEFWANSPSSESNTEALLQCLKLNESSSLMTYCHAYQIEETKFCSSFTKHILIYEYLGDTLKLLTERWAKRKTKDGKSRVVSNQAALLTVSLSRSLKFGTSSTPSRIRFRL